MYDRSMDASRILSQAGSLIGDPSRAAMLWGLVGGESRPASELAMLANVSPQTASNHLKLLLDAGFVKATVIGRNKFYRLSGHSVAAALEAMAAAFPGNLRRDGLAHQSAPELVFARTCYDHLAGALGVALLDRLRQKGHLREHASDYHLTSAGEEFFSSLGIDLNGLRAKRRRFACPCLDWSQRVPHLGGALGAALLDWLMSSRTIVRRNASRAVRPTETGEKKLDRIFGIRIAQNGRELAGKTGAGA